MAFKLSKDSIYLWNLTLPLHRCTGLPSAYCLCPSFASLSVCLILFHLFSLLLHPCTLTSVPVPLILKALPLLSECTLGSIT